MLTSLPASTQVSTTEIFSCPEESNFYSYCIENLVLRNSLSSTVVLEFGTGDGIPVIDAVKRTNFRGQIYGFEVDTAASKVAQSNLEKYRLHRHYFIKSECFFKANKPSADYLISNPPYIPSLDNNIYNPFLHGGVDGSQIARQLLSLDYDHVMLLVSSYSNPQSLINYALCQGYYVDNFLITPLNFGKYSSEPKVRNHLEKMKGNSLAFYSQNIYLLAGVLFKKQHKLSQDLSAEFNRVMTSL